MKPVTAMASGTVDPAEAGRERTVLHVITDLNTGGAEMMLLKLLSRQQTSSFHPVVLSLMGGGTLLSRFEDLGVRVYSAGMKEGRPTPGAAVLIARIAREVRPDIVLGWMYHGNLAALLAAAAAPGRVPVLWNVRHALSAYDAYPRLTAAVIKLGALLSGRPAAIIYNSHQAAANHETLGYRRERRVILPNGFDTTVYRPDPAARREVRGELGIGESVPVIGLIGRFHAHKDQFTFLEAAALLLEKQPDARFVMAGRGVEQGNTRLSERVETLGLDGCVRLLGERADMPRLNAAFDIAASSSTTESFPNAIGEAMACGTPCAVTDVGDSGRLVGDTGRVVPPRDPARLSEAWRELLTLSPDERSRLGARARDRIIECFSLDAVAQQYETLFDKVLTERGAEV